MAFRITSRIKLRILFIVKSNLGWFGIFLLLLIFWLPNMNTLYNIFKLKGLSKQVPKIFKIKPLYDELFFMLIKLWINLLGQVLLFHLKPHILLFSHCSFSSIVGFASVFLSATYPNTQWPLWEIFVQKKYLRWISNLGKV